MMKPIYLLLVLICLSFNEHHNGTIDLKAHKKFERQFSAWKFIPSGTFTKGYSTDYAGRSEMVNCNTPDTANLKTVYMFYMLDHEVTNKEYRDFVKSIQKQFGKDSARKLLPDSLGWMQKYSHYGEPAGFGTMYHSHPGYDDYPIVNITVEQSRMYCKWLEKELMKNENFPFEQISVGLPTETEWEYAAVANFSYFPWEGDELYDQKGKPKAAFLSEADFKLTVKRIGNSDSVSGYSNASRYWGNDYYPVKIKSFKPNEYGLYDMAGNVAEFVLPAMTDKSQPAIYVTKGGSHLDPPYYLQCGVADTISADSTARPARGFRPVFSITE